MRLWPFERRKRISDAGGRYVGQGGILALVKQSWPASSISPELGSREFFAPFTNVYPWMMDSAFYDLRFKPEPEKFDCERFTRKRLTQMDEFVYDWTDLMNPMALFEVRGTDENGIGHSMLLTIHYRSPGDPALELIQPFNGMERKPLSFMRGVRLVYA